MELEIVLPPAPVTLAPGAATRVPVELRNPWGTPMSVHVRFARGRASGWATVDPPAAELSPGATVTVDVVLHPPADQPPSPSLVPFTVHAEDASTGEPAGFATGLITVALPIPVTGSLTRRPGDAHTYDLRLANDSGTEAAVRVTARLDPPAGSVTAEPAAMRLAPGESVTSVVRARPNRPVLGSPRPYAVVVTVADALDTDRAPMLTEVGTGTRKPRVASWMAGATAVVLALAATAAVAFSGINLPLPGRRATATKAAPVAPSAPAPVPVARPYALVEVVPHRGADGGRAAAEAARSRLSAAGMPIRLVDSLSTDVLSNEAGGFWVLLQDGFANIEAAQAYCTQWRVVAPKCTVTS